MLQVGWKILDGGGAAFCAALQVHVLVKPGQTSWVRIAHQVRYLNLEGTFQPCSCLGCDGASHLDLGPFTRKQGRVEFRYLAVSDQLLNPAQAAMVVLVRTERLKGLA
jgi:hypothetical protein